MNYPSCPKCGSNYLTMTTTGIVVGKDAGIGAKVWCNCGWKGLAYELVNGDSHATERPQAEAAASSTGEAHDDDPHAIARMLDEGCPHDLDHATVKRHSVNSIRADYGYPSLPSYADWKSLAPAEANSLREHFAQKCSAREPICFRICKWTAGVLSRWFRTPTAPSRYIDGRDPGVQVGPGASGPSRELTLADRRSDSLSTG